MTKNSTKMQSDDIRASLSGWMALTGLAATIVIFLAALLGIQMNNDWWLSQPDRTRTPQLGEALGGWLGFLLLVVLVTAVVVVILARTIARRQSTVLRASQERLETAVAQYTAYLLQVGEGDLTAHLDLDGYTDLADPLVRLGRGLKETVSSLQTMALQLRQEVVNVSEAATEILNATNEQIIAATEQDSSVTQTAATVNEVRATVTETAERSQAVAETARRTVDVTRTGEQAVSDSINGMHLIRQRVESIADTILILSEHTQQIGEIIATVNAIADQSNMLALNASVEAARAGEEGKGFAVVAMEVRSLAAQSRQAVSQIRDILSEIQQTTNTAVMVTEQGTKGVDSGMELVDRAGETIRELAAAIEEASHAATQIAASTRQQTVGMDQLSEAMQTIRDMTATNLSSTMRVERAARELNQISRRMGQTVSKYQAARET
ncbi:MAG: hypothetical protein JXB47_20575 [Anaerolineae bacterium]|nr:hypothetical protein [Anaerolineae bacterium]